MRKTFDDIHHDVEVQAMRHWKGSEPNIPMVPWGDEFDTTDIDEYIMINVIISPRRPGNIGRPVYWRTQGQLFCHIYTSIDKGPKAGRDHAEVIFQTFCDQNLAGYRFHESQLINPIVEGRFLRTQLVLPFQVDHQSG